MVALQALYNALPLGAFIAAMTALSGWGFEQWGANVFWVMAAMGFIALFVKVTPVSEESHVIDVAKAEPKAQN